MGEPKSRKHADDLRAAASLVVTATTGVTDVVEDMHRTIASGPAILGRPLRFPAQLITRIAYGNVKGVTRIVGIVLDRALERIAPFLGESTPGPEREAVLAALNGVVGDWLEETGSPFAIPLELRHPDPPTGARLLVLLHGSSMSAGQWLRNGHDHGSALATEHGFTPIYANYNSGRHISTNGHAFADALEALVASWPEPVTEIVLLGHSMGGLVARSACHSAEQREQVWRKKVARLVTLGTPHNGSPIERGGRFIHALLGVSSYSAPIARLAEIRSAGVTDLRFGFVLDEHWQGKKRFSLASDAPPPLPLPAGVECRAIAAAADVMVPIASAFGGFPEANCVTVADIGHLDLLDSAEVHTTLRTWLAPG